MSFVAALCRYKYHIRNIFVLSTTATLVLLATLPAIQRGSETYAVAMFQVVTFTAVALCSLALMVHCGGRDDEPF